MKMVTNRLSGNLPIASAASAADEISSDDTVAVSGFGSVGYPKDVPLALAESNRSLSLTVISGGSVGPEIDEALVEADAIERRFHYQARPVARKAINDGEIAFHDRHVAGLSDEIAFDLLSDTDIAIIEAVAVGEGWLIPSTSIGHATACIETADRLIVEVNEAQPLSLQRLHDIYSLSPPPRREPIPLTAPGERIGESAIRFDSTKLYAVVQTDQRDSPYSFRDSTDDDRKIVENLGSYLAREVQHNPALTEAVRLQFGVGSLGNALMGELGSVDFGDRDVAYYGEVIQDGLLDLLDAGQLSAASATSLALSEDGQDRLFADIDRYAEDIVLRPANISNAPEVINRLGVIAVNSALEVDLSGHVNSTHSNGTRIINGIGGSGDFNRNSLVAITALPSTTDNANISRVVPMVPHVDHTEHDVDVIVTEQGVADLRGLSPRERATELIDHCAHPDFQPDLRTYVERAEENGGHIPLDPTSAFSWRS
jgi:succinyl-CoA:acetate CoA-transferase